MSKLSIPMGIALLFAGFAGAASAAERVLLAPPSGAASARSIGSASEKSLPSAAKETQRGEIAKLRTRAARESTVRVIIGFRVPFAPEGELTPRELAQQQKEITDAGQALRRKFPDAAKRGDIGIIPSIPFASMEVTRQELDQLQADPNILTIVEDQISQPLLTYSVPLIGAPEAWKGGATGAGQAVAVIDHGAQTNHPFLFDSAGNSKVVFEANCSAYAGCEQGPGKAYAGVTRSTAHGTAVAGIIAGERANPPLKGVAPDAKLIVLRAYYTGDITIALQKVYELRDQYKIAAASISLGLAPLDPSCDLRSPALTAIINNLRVAGIATIAAAGNEGATDRMYAPACISTVVSVGAIYPSTMTGSVAAGNFTNYTSYRCGTFYEKIEVDKVACFSNTSPRLSLLAPGFPIETAGINGYNGIKDNYEPAFNGTSAATPHVAGAFAILKSKAPKASVTEILAALRATGKPIRDNRTGLTTPRIDVGKALAYLQANRSQAIDYIASGEGTGIVSFSPAASQASCRKNCSIPYPAGTKVTMTARADPGSVFFGWTGTGGQCGEAESCTVTVSDSTTAIALFGVPGSPVFLDVYFNGNGAGEIWTDVGNNNLRSCRNSCSIQLKLGSGYAIQARSAPGSALTSWSGMCQGSAAWCTVTPGKFRNKLTVTFNSTSGTTRPCYTLSYSKAGAGSGQLSAMINGVSTSCSGSCSTTQPEGTAITLTAQPATNSLFSGWSGACTGNAATCTVTLRSAQTAVATFGQKPAISNVSLIYMKSGSGTISATVNGSTTSCAGSCTLARPAGTQVTLTAQPGPDAVFKNWAGGCTGNALTCVVTLRAGSVVLATFQTKSGNSLASSK